MTGHRIILQSLCRCWKWVQLPKDYKQHPFKYECKTIHVRGLLDGSELIVSNIKKQRIQKWKLQRDTHNIRMKNQHPKEVSYIFCIVNNKAFIIQSKLTVIIKYVIFQLPISQCDYSIGQVSILVTTERSCHEKIHNIQNPIIINWQIISYLKHKMSCSNTCFNNNIS